MNEDGIGRDSTSTRRAPVPRDFFPRRLADVLSWSRNFAGKIQIDPERYSLAPEQSAHYALTLDAFAALLRTAHDPTTRTRSAVSARNDALAALETETRLLARIVRAAPAVTDAMRIDLGLSVSKGGGAGGGGGAPTQRPGHAPGIEVIAIVGRTVRLRLRDTSSPHRGRPAGVAGALIYSHAGEPAAAGPIKWTSHGITTRTTAEVKFDPSVPAGAKVLISACWFSPRGLTGPAATPVSAYLQDGVSVPATSVAHRAA
jgi:hypothetical protein